jgi:hypothetical protein
MEGECDMRETREEINARLSKRLTDEQLLALADALDMSPEEIEPTNGLGAVVEADRRGVGNTSAAINILLDAGIVIPVQPA